MIKKLDGQFVVPGEKLGVVEEFMPGRGTVEVDGTVFSSQTGVAAVDSNRHIVSVKAYCSRCGGELVLSGRILRCTLCLNVERRRLAEDFGAGGNVPS